MKKWPLPFPKPHPLPPKTFVKADGVKGGTASHALAAVPPAESGRERLCQSIWLSYLHNMMKPQDFPPFFAEGLHDWRHWGGIPLELQEKNANRFLWHSLCCLFEIPKNKISTIITNRFFKKKLKKLSRTGKPPYGIQ